MTFVPAGPFDLLEPPVGPALPPPVAVGVLLALIHARQTLLLLGAPGREARTAPGAVLVALAADPSTPAERRGRGVGRGLLAPNPGARALEARVAILVGFAGRGEALAVARGQTSLS